MQAICLNIPRAFRSTSQIRRSDYEQINDGMGSQFLSLKFIILYCFGLISIFSGMAAIAYGYTIPGSLLILMIPTGCCLYWPLKSLNWSRYCRCLRGICCFAPVDIETPNQPTTPQVLTDSSTPPQSLAD
ncbi:uncharacterized protein LOC129976508 [Argiope bruennichi]|uniref:Uncharacterized protein n=1 Tax=Argiope bruennichi TaxID=94029 RepID=A0A8T0EW98_ARGBR|nr:uncharacterized protein LOC129976508 [Argiope bruennichi]KAF8778656.1 hypothetical protein HNY73_015359 [Argiope bruennichi]